MWEGKGREGKDDMSYIFHLLNYPSFTPPYTGKLDGAVHKYCKIEHQPPPDKSERGKHASWQQECYICLGVGLSHPLSVNFVSVEGFLQFLALQNQRWTWY